MSRFIQALIESDEMEHGETRLNRGAAAELARLQRALSLLRAVNKTGGVVVEYHRIGSESRPLRDWITELLNEIDGKVEAK
jgi:hypothetical protein